MKEKTEAQDSPLAQGLEDPPLSDRCHETRGWRNRLRASRDQLSLSISLSLSLSLESSVRRKAIRRLLRWLFSAASPSVSLIGGVVSGDSSRRPLSLWSSTTRRSSLWVSLLKSKGKRLLCSWICMSLIMSDLLFLYVVCWLSLSVGLLLQAFPRWLKSKLSPQIER